MRKAIILIGPPGSGKGTQADILAYRFGLLHFDTGRYLEDLYQEKRMPLKIRRQFAKGLLVDPIWASKVFREQVRKIASTGFGIVFSGSPRTVFEAFGDRKTRGIMDVLIRTYGKKNILVFELGIPPRVTIARNSKRRICSICWKSHLLGPSLKNCPFCGGELVRRVQDRPSIIKKRLEEYEERTKPILRTLRARKFKVVKIDGRPKASVVFEKITRHLK